jgi:hypothetical protein
MSQAFQSVGWRGLVVTPNAAHHQMLTLSRPGDSVALAVAGCEEGLTTVFCDSAATIATRDPDRAERYGRAGQLLRPTDVPIRRLATLIRAWGEPAIDFLVLQADGSEAAALAGAGLRATRPRAIVLRGRPGDDTTAWLASVGYRPTEFIGLHQFYLAEEDYHELADCFVLPPHAADLGMVSDSTPIRLLSGVVEQALAAGREAARQVIEAEREVSRSQAALAQAREDTATLIDTRQAKASRIDSVAGSSVPAPSGLQHRADEDYASSSWKLMSPLVIAAGLLRAFRGAARPVPSGPASASGTLPTGPMPSLRSPFDDVMSGRHLAGALPNIDALP